MIFDSSGMKDVMIYLHSYLPWCLILTGFLIRKIQVHKTR